MNARMNSLNLTLECRQIKDAVCVAFHTILLNRTAGKMNYTSNTNYNLGSIGFEESECEHIDLTYIRINSPALITELDVRIDEYNDALRNIINGSLMKTRPQTLSSSNDDAKTYGIGSWENVIVSCIKLEFFQKRKRQWPLTEDHTPWEIWELNLNLVRTNNTEDFYRMRGFVGEKLGDLVFSRSELTSAYDNRFCDCQPYNFKIRYDLLLTCEHSSESSNKGNFVRNLIQDVMI